MVIINLLLRGVGESLGIANDGEWRTPHFPRKWKKEGTMKLVNGNYLSFTHEINNKN